MTSPTSVLLTVLLHFTGTSFGQISGRIVSETDQKPIPYATIYLKNTAVGTHSDENGRFTLSGTTAVNDSLFIQSIGYTPLKTVCTKNQGEFVFSLKENPLVLPSVDVRKSKRIKSVWKGASERHTNFIVGQMGGSVLREVAVLIPNDEQHEGYLSEVAFFVVRFGQPKTPFRVRIYKPAGDVPGDDLLTENLVVHASRGNSYCVADVSRFAIPFGKEGVYISMEWLNLADKKYVYTVKMSGSKATRTFYGQQIGLTGEFDELRGKERINNGPWKTMTAGFSSPMFKAKIDVYE